MVFNVLVPYLPRELRVFPCLRPSESTVFLLRQYACMRGSGACTMHAYFFAGHLQVPVITDGLGSEKEALQRGQSIKHARARFRVCTNLIKLLPYTGVCFGRRCHVRTTGR